ncbi:MAG TPA: rod-binding protein [Sphingobium sp.]|nr:rod-binding protein [Sphingobium sp.]
MTQLATIGTGIGAGGGITRRETDQRAEMAQAAKAFEAIFVRQLVGTMRQSSLGDELTGSSAVDQFRELADARMADNLADKGGLGIAELILSQLEKTP